MSKQISAVKEAEKEAKKSLAKAEKKAEKIVSEGIINLDKKREKEIQSANEAANAKIAEMRSKGVLEGKTILADSMKQLSKYESQADKNMGSTVKFIVKDLLEEVK